MLLLLSNFALTMSVWANRVKHAPKCIVCLQAIFVWFDSVSIDITLYRNSCIYLCFGRILMNFLKSYTFVQYLKQTLSRKLRLVSMDAKIPLGKLLATASVERCCKFCGINYMPLEVSVFPLLNIFLTT